jgi:phenylalanyl-tRNA synthetase beta chain
MESRLGVVLSDEEIQGLLGRMGHRAEPSPKKPLWLVRTPAFRDDVMHEVDLAEDVAIARGFESFEPILPERFTVGRLSRLEELADQARDLMVGAGYQELMSPILTSREALLDRMLRTEAPLVEIDNVMSRSFGVLRDTLFPALLAVEAANPKAPYPHRIFEVGEVARQREASVTGTRTLTTLGCLSAHAEACISEMQSLLDVLNHLMGWRLKIAPQEHPSFMEGRCAALIREDTGASVGILGEFHPGLLEIWGISMPLSGLEISLTDLL